MRSTKELIEWLKEIAEVNGVESFAEAAKHVEQLESELEVIMQQRDNYRHQSTALNLLNEELEERCAELERGLEWMQIKYNTEMRIRQAYQSCSEEMARKAFVDGADWQMNEQAYNEGVIAYAADQYVEREYGVDPKQ